MHTTQNNNINITVIIALLLFILVSCGKDPLTLPAKVYFEFGFIAHEKEETVNDKNLEYKSASSSPSSPKLQIDQGTLTIESITFDGRREEAKDVFFTSDLSEPLVIDLETGESTMQLQFDIPQGIYYRIEIDLQLGENNNKPLVLEGSYHRLSFDDSPGLPNFEEVPVRFEYDITDNIRVRAKPGKNKSNIILDKDAASTANIVVDANSIFHSVNLGMIKNASPVNIEGEEVILISHETNNNLYSRISARLDKSFSIIID